jgi:hypothetical protein
MKPIFALSILLLVSCDYIPVPDSKEAQQAEARKQRQYELKLQTEQWIRDMEAEHNAGLARNAQMEAAEASYRPFGMRIAELEQKASEDALLRQNQVEAEQGLRDMMEQAREERILREEQAHQKEMMRMQGGSYYGR